MKIRNWIHFSEIEVNFEFRDVCFRVLVRHKTTLASSSLLPDTDLHFYLMFVLPDGRVTRASASGAVDLGLITSRVKPMALKIAIHSFLLDAQL